MIGYVLTGHGEFANGLQQSLEMIAGPQEHFDVIDFIDERPLEDYESALSEAITRLAESTDGLIVFSDLLGGTPFKTAMMTAHQMDNVAVMSGTNLPMLVESSVLRLTALDAKILARHLVETGRDGVQFVELSIEESDATGEEEMEGI